MKQNKTEIIIVLDRSGSMATMKNDMEGGLKIFLQEQKKLSGECYLTLYQFDTFYEKLYEAQNLDFINEIIISPRGSTALIDAIGYAVTDTGMRFNRMAEKDRPQGVIFVIITDGEENSSREYSLNQIKNMVKLQTDTYNWKFVFLGANIDSIKIGESYGFGSGTSMDYNKAGAKDTFRSLSSYASSVRQDATFDGGFTDKDRQNAVK